MILSFVLFNKKKRERKKNWLKWFALPRSRTDSNDLRSAVPIWLKWFALRGPDLTQMIRAPRSRSDSHDSRSADQIGTRSDSHDSRSADQIGTRSDSHDSRSRTDSNDSRFALRGPDLTRMIHAPRSRSDSNDSRFAGGNCCFNDVRFDIISILLKTKQITLNSVLWNLVTLD